MDQDKYLPELMAEKDSLDPSFVHAIRLLAEGKIQHFWFIDNIHSTSGASLGYLACAL